MNASHRFRSAAAGPHVRPFRTHDRGSALFLLLILAVVLATVLGGIFSYIGTTAKMEKRSNLRIESTYAAEYAFEQAYQQLNTLINSNTQNAPDIAHTTAVTNLSVAPTSTFGAADGYSWKSFITVPVENGFPVDAFSSFNSQSGVYKYMSVVEFTRTVPGMTAPVHMQFQREWDYALMPLFQYAIFYNDDLELFPGAAFVVGGTVHTNSRLYTASGASVTFNDSVTYVKGYSNNYSPNDPRSQGTLNRPIFNAGPATATAIASPPGLMNEDTTDSNHNNDGPRELIEIPDVHSTDPSAAERMYNKAGVKILVNTTGSAVTADSGVAIGANSMVLMTADGTVIPSTDPLATVISGAVSKGSLKDYRENATFTTTDIDLSKLTAAYSGGGLPTTIPTSANWPNNSSVPAALKGQPIPTALQGKNLWNGILYVTDVTNSASHRTGVKVINGASLPDGSNASSSTAGLTIVTSNAAFVIGDYNTGGTAACDTGAATDNNCASGYTVQPSAIMADAVTVLSSNWTASGYDSQSNVNNRPAANTTVNAALISGIVASTKSGSSPAYSGGVENFIRLLENWSGKRLTYYGSIVNLYESQESTAAWGNSSYYNPPSRNWYFDTNFRNPNRLPPGTPIIRSLVRGQWVQIE